jgi:hypothetical protein
MAHRRLAAPERSSGAAQHERATIGAPEEAPGTEEVEPNLPTIQEGEKRLPQISQV